VHKAAKAGDGGKKIWIISAVVLVVALAGVMAVALASEDSASDVRAGQTADVTVDGDPLPLNSADNPTLAVGSPAPTLSGTSLTGEPMTIGNDGRPKVIGFFTHWCEFCQAEVPEVSEWWNAGNAPDDVDIVAVNTSVNSARANYPPSAWYERENWDIPTLLDDPGDTAAFSYGLSGYPYWVVVDADGNVVARQSGQIGIPQFEALIDRARTGA
jgi:thiol-disulfide isomerase/thioredoxin